MEEWGRRWPGEWRVGNRMDDRSKDEVMQEEVMQEEVRRSRIGPVDMGWSLGQLQELKSSTGPRKPMGKVRQGSKRWRRRTR
jgi:hypothetical protein